MFRCPDCREQLIRGRGNSRVFWICPQDHGRAVTFAALKAELEPEFAKDLWRRVQAETFPKDRSCPDCYKPMHCISVVGESKVVLDACKTCTFLWLDFGELEGLPFKPRSPDTLSPEARQSVALIEAEARIEELKASNKKLEELAPDKVWKYVPAVFGLPIEMKRQPLDKWPIVTYLLGALVLFTSVWAFYHPDLFRLFSLVPADFRIPNLLSTFFLHGGWLHLILNLYFFVTFGDDVEHYLGHWKYVVLVALATVVGSLGHVVTHAHSFVPVVGASGGIAGILAFYALTFPKAKLGVGIARILVPIPAWAAMILWLVFQLWGAFRESDHDAVAYFGHLGGVLGGVIFWLIMRIFARSPR